MLVHHLLIKSLRKGILLIPLLLVSWFGNELGAPQRLESAEWGFAQEGNIMYELLYGCVLLTITNSVFDAWKGQPGTETGQIKRNKIDIY